MPRAGSNHHYPIFLDLAGERALVIGAGRVAGRKIRGLLRGGAGVTVVAPQATLAIRAWAGRKRLRWIERRFRVADLRGHQLVYCATDHPQVDAAAARAARRRGLLVNCASSPALGNFILPATARRGPVRLAVSTGGASPLLAVRVARALAAGLDRHFAGWASLLQQLRPRILEQVPRHRRPALWKLLTSERIGELMRAGRRPVARKLALQLIAQAARVQPPRGVKR